ncbi:ras-related protein Rab-9B isoform X1 [Tachysurus fulvidraco]|uniref:ras-related protein Rab-9B isoform X1 n=2 Tax=Tachysurus fulvidraco TaxID=1234273 RepID=UPI000F50C2C9|nr:ras-related protein Rab-9B isoform X1 [Tachysurus fulvidraco]
MLGVNLQAGHVEPAVSGIMSGKSLLLKVILLGDGGVGKSSLMNRYVSDRFDSHSFHTIGVEFLNRDLEVDGRPVTLQIWDTAGQERFRSLRTPFYRGADCCLLTFAVDDAQSFHNLSAWKQEFVRYSDVREPERFPFVVLGNKVDKVEDGERQVPEEEARAWCQENGHCPYFETSAKDDTNVSAAFEAAVREVLACEDHVDHTLLGSTIDLHGNRKASRSSCC